MRKVIHRILIVAILTLFSLPIASAHGDGNSQEINNSDVMSSQHQWFLHRPID